MKSEYSGRAYSIDEIIGMLRSQGLTIGDEDKTRHILLNVSYSRLKSYLVPLMEDRSTHRFKPGASIEQAYAIYGFDRRLRELIFHELEKVEVSIRTHIAYASNDREAGYWYTNPANFRNPKNHQRLLYVIQREVNRSDNDAIKSFRNKYSNEYVPSWLALEATSMGTLSIIYDTMNYGEMRSGIASCYGLDEWTFSSWLRHIVYIRNYCAHHNRIWNNRPGVKAVIPRKTANPFPRFREGDTENIYYTLCIIKYFQNTVKPTNSLTQRLSSLIDRFPVINVRDMGFPADWKGEKLWEVKV